MIYKSEYKSARVDIHTTLHRLVSNGAWKIDFESNQFDTLRRIIPHFGLQVNIIFDDWIDFSPEDEQMSARIHDITIEKYRTPLQFVLNEDLSGHPVLHAYNASPDPSGFEKEVALGDLPVYIQSMILEDMSHISFWPMGIDPFHAFSNPFKRAALYEPEDLRSFHVSMYEYIDDFSFMRFPAEIVNDHYLYEEVAKEMFLKAGWHGDGEIMLIWVPPFLPKAESPVEGSFSMPETYVWHVKQKRHGTSYLLSPFK